MEPMGILYYTNGKECDKMKQQEIGKREVMDLLQPKIIESQKRRYYEQGYWTEKTLLDYWNIAAQTYREREYITDSRGLRLTYGEIDSMASRLAKFLQQRGVKPGEIIACQIPVWYEFAVLAVACWKIGAVIHPISISYEAPDVAYFLDLHKPVVFVCPSQFRNRDYGAQIQTLLPQAPQLQQVILLEYDQPEKGKVIGLSEILQSCPELQADTKISASDDVAVLLCTSGSTGVSKGAMLTHNNILFAELQFNRELGLTKDDVMFMPSPLNHATGFQHGLIATMLMGARVVLQQKFQVAQAVDLMNQEGCTYSMGATTFVHDILHYLEETGKSLDSMRFYLCGGAPVPSVMVQTAWKYGLRLCEVYGSTESTPHIFTPPEETLFHNGTISGRPVVGVEVRVVNENGQDVADGEEGEEWSRGPNVFVGYTTEHPAGCSLDDDGWFHSGDLCVKNADGYVRITGRVKDIIIRGGENLNANQLNENLAGCPQLKEHTVIGMPDERMGERICAYAVLREGEDAFTLMDLLSYLQNKGVPKWQWPEHLEIVEALPKTDSGKIKKYVLVDDIRQKQLKGGRSNG